MIKKKYQMNKYLSLAIESGADECISQDDYHEVQCAMNEIYNVKKKLEKIIVILFQQKLNGYH